jgi:hypothetical protein
MHVPRTAFKLPKPSLHAIGFKHSGLEGDTEPARIAISGQRVTRSKLPNSNRCEVAGPGHLRAKFRRITLWHLPTDYCS